MRAPSELDAERMAWMDYEPFWRYNESNHEYEFDDEAPADAVSSFKLYFGIKK